MEMKEFSRRLSMLRLNKDVSARDMSLSPGQSAGYINNIATGVNFPSMTAFFYICDYLGIAPKAFFDVDSADSMKEKELLQAVKGLRADQLEHVIAIAKGLNEKMDGMPQATRSKKKRKRGTFPVGGSSCAFICDMFAART